MTVRQIVAVCFGLLFSNLVAQDVVINSRVLTVSDGMVGRNVRSIAEDLESNIWIATDLGVTVFDGLELAKPDQLPAEIDNVRFDEIYCTQDGLLWFWSSFAYPDNLLDRFVDNYQIYDPVTNKVVSLFEDPANQIKRIWPGDNGKIWFLTNEGRTFAYDTALSAELDLESEHLIQIFERADIRFQLYANKLEEYQSGQLLHRTALAHESQRAIYSENGYIYLINNFVYTENLPFLAKYDRQRKELVYCDYGNKDLGIGSNAAQVFMSDYKENIVIFFGEEIIIMDPDKLSILGRQNLHDWQRPPISINDFFISSNGKFWLAANEGLLLAEFSERLVKNYFANESYSFRGIDNWNEDTLLVATYSGTFFLNKHDGKYKPGPIGINEALLYGVVKFKDNMSIGGTHSRDYFTLNYKTNEIRVKQFEDPGYVYQAYLPQALNNGEYWFGTSFGAFRYETSADNFFKPVSIENSPMDKLPIRAIRWIDGKYFFCTEKGMYVADESLDPVYIASLGDNIITDILKDGDQFWVSTFGEGLKQLNVDYTVEAEYNKATIGFSNDFIYSIHDDGLGYFWLPTNNGLIRFEKESKNFETFLPKDGFANYEYNNSSSFIDAAGDMYFGGTDGMSKITPSDFVETEKEALFDISKLGYTEPGGELVPIEFQRNVPIELPSNYLTFSLSIFSKNFAIEEGIEYIYRILNYSDDWRPIENNKLSLNRLPFGDYVLEVKPLVTGHRRSELISVPIAVDAPFYFQPVFILSLLCGLALLTFLYIRWRTHQLRLRNVLLSKQVQERTQELSKRNAELLEINDTRDRLFGIIAHDLRGPLIGFKDLDKKIKFLNTKNRFGDLERLTNTVQENYENLTNLLDNLLHWISIQRGRLPIKLEANCLGDQIDDALNLYDQTIRQKEIQIIREGPTVEVLADPDAIDILLRNLLNNALKYSHPKGRIWIATFENEEEASLVVADEGIGMNEDELKNLFSVKARRGRQGTRGEKSTGLGLPLCKEFIDLMNGRIEVKSELNKGTRFVISLPKFQSSSADEK